MTCNTSYPEPFHSLCWHRLPVTLLNIRTSPSMSAHPITVIQAIIKGVTESMGKAKEPLIFFHVKNRRYAFRMRESDRLELEIFFFQKGAEYISRWVKALRQYLSDPETGKNFEITDIGEIHERSFDILASETEAIPAEGEICLEFTTPFPFKREKDRHRTYITKESFIRSFEKRFSRLFGDEIAYKSSGDSFSLLPYYWSYTEIRRASVSQPGHTQYINGCIGKLYLKGQFNNLLPFLILGSELHTGSKLSNSLGHYLLHRESAGYFESYFPNKKAIVSVIRDVLERYDSALESLSAEGNVPFNEEDYADTVVRQIVTDTYTPTPNTAFLIKKESGVDRIVEQLSFSDLIIQQYILKTVSRAFDRIFEEGSIGFRKGVSRQKAIEIVQSAVSEGYQYVVESDIEDFFPSVDFGVLTGLLDFYIPQKDSLLKALILKTIKNGYVLKGAYHERTKGLAQGSPLSPVLANLYLDSFDEKIMSWNVKIVRYADDFVIMTRTKEEAVEILSRTEAFLSEIGLKLKKEKTAVRHIRDGFRFLGMRFERSEAVVEPEEEYRRFKKPLYITEPYLFLALNGDAIEIKKSGVIKEAIPLRRISEIIVMERSTFSTALLTKCTESNIPLTITLNSGYYVTTIKPDSKKYHDISFEHARKFYSLTDTEILSIAKEFAAGKLSNYASLFKQKYVKTQNLFIGELNRVIQRIHQAGDIHQVRGFEGAAAKKIYQKLNSIIDNKEFHIKKRQRKNPDMINSLLNFGYYLLFSRINATVRAVGLNPYLGFLHSPEDNYESFVCDIQELFRSRIDRFIVRMINLKSIKKDDFIETQRGLYLQKEALKRFLNQFEAEMERKGSKKTLSLNESIYVQTMVIKKYVLEDKPLTFYTWNV